MTLARSNVVIAAVRADAERAQLLEVRAGTPLLLLRETHYDPAGKPVLFTVNHHNSNLVQFILTRAGLHVVRGAGFFAIGNISIDDLVFADGATMWCVPGGNCDLLRPWNGGVGRTPGRDRPDRPRIPNCKAVRPDRSRTVPPHRTQFAQLGPL